MTDVDTIFALSSGSPPAGIAIIRISGSSAGAVLVELTGRPLPEPRIASLALLSNPGDSAPLDRALTLWFPGPASATGEDVAELHLHGGRAVVAAVSRTLAGFVGLREAEPGEFTRRAFEHGRIDFAEAEALGDLLSAETEMQRRSAIAQVGGALHRLTGEWANRIVSLSARVEAMIDFSDEDDVEPLPFTALWREASMVALDIREALSRPPAERLRDGLRVAIVGPPNSGKSTLLNRLVGRDAAIVSEIPGTTRDLIEAPVSLMGLPLIFVDTAGIRDSEDRLEQIGVARARQEMASADIVLNLDSGTFDQSSNAINLLSKSDLGRVDNDRVIISGKTGEGIDRLIARITGLARSLLPSENHAVLNGRHRQALHIAVFALEDIADQTDEILVAEQLRIARRAIADVTGGNDAEDVLDVLFGSFCIGK